MPRPDVRSALTTSALELFDQLGYEGTTVGAIADHAGVGRRTFFRHFATKDDAVLPDHEALLSRVRSVLDGWSGDPLDALVPAAHVVLDTYLAEQDAAVARYRLLTRVPELRDRERAVVTRYQLAFAAFLRDRLPAAADRDLRADVLAAAVVAAHNSVLRSWLRAPGPGAAAALDDALAWVVSALAGGGQRVSVAERTLARVRQVLSEGADAGSTADSSTV